MNKSDDNRYDEIVKRLNDDIFIALFRKGAYEYLEDGLPESHSGSGDTLSDGSEKSIMRLIKKELRREKTRKAVSKFAKVAAIFVIVLAVCTVTVVSVEAFRVPVFNLFIKDNDESTDISVGKEDPAHISTQENANAPIYIPAGYELSSTEEYADITKHIYTNADGGYIIIGKYGLGSYIGFDTEDAENKKVDINGYEALYSIKKGLIFLSFRTEEYAYLIDSSADVSEVIKIAESIK